MLLEATSFLPLDVWLVLLDYIEIRDFPSLLTTHTSIKRLVDQELVYERRARNLYPPTLLDITKYKKNNNNTNINNDDDYGNDDDDYDNETTTTTTTTTNTNTTTDDDGCCCCWKELIRSRNCENGVYIRRFYHKYSTWYNNNNLRCYVSSIRAMIWDVKLKQILITVEGFGHHDLRPADSSLISYVNYNQNKIEIPLQALYAEAWTYRPGYVLVPMLRIQLPPPRQHDLCQLIFDEDDFNNINKNNNNNNNSSSGRSGSSRSGTTKTKTKTKNISFIFTYSGNMNQFGRRGIRSDDYSSVVFLEHEDEEEEGSNNNNNTNMLSNIFDLSRQDCEFIPRDDINRYMLPSNILEWDVELPDNIRNLHTQKRWGNISRRVLHPTATTTTSAAISVADTADNNNNNVNNTL